MMITTGVTEFHFSDQITLDSSVFEESQYDRLFRRYFYKIFNEKFEYLLLNDSAK
jgi:hypothetical protein